ncbi:MAG: selenocysteine-specific translation elongation factor [Chloroflexi bacterium]|nr:selenocysteine-specific translation elongation factor [Chloroflexota bacterium]
MYVVGTAGHVDHGKSSLVHALTGIDPDRLEEEKLREMTIDLGFAWLTLPKGETIGLVDVPGHRDFIENMLAGVGGIDAALFVVAADEGVMPQTREHLAILDLLGVEAAVVALTKADLAESEEWLELVMADVSETLDGTTLANAPIIPVSAKTGMGLDALKLELEHMLSSVDPRRDIGRPRLPVDRVFSVSGFGTVVTGTLTDGCLTVGQEIELLPAGLKARIRGLQTHKHKVERAMPGSRVAVNLSGVNRANVERGAVVTTPDWLRPTVLVDVQIRYLQDMTQPLRHNAQVKLFSGAAESLARVRLLGQEVLPPGERGWAQLRLRAPMALVKGDRFVLRLPSPAATIGGGIIIDPHPRRRHKRFRPETIARLETLARGTPAEVLLQELVRLEPISVGELLSASSLSEGALLALRELESTGQAIVLGSSIGASIGAEHHAVDSRALVASHSWWSAAIVRITELLTDHHRQYPLRGGMPREALRSALKIDARPFNALMTRAVDEMLLVDEGAFVRLPDHEIRLTDDQQARVSALLTRFHQQPYTPPSMKEATAEIGDDVLSVLVSRRELKQLSPEVLLLPDVYDQMQTRVVEYIRQNGSITLAQVRDLFQTSRKYAQALIEYMDAEGITRRVGDERILR